MNRFIYILVIIFFSVGTVFSQTKSDRKQLYKMSKVAFDNENYRDALPLLLRYDSLFPNNNEIVYRIGACYLNSEFDKKKAIPYLEQALSEKKNKLPSATFKDLAHLYHLNYQFGKSEAMYKRYLAMEPKSKDEIEHLLASIEIARQLTQDSLKFKIQNIGLPVNTNQSEIMPYVSADESILYYQNKETKDFYLAYNKDDKWIDKINLDIPNLINYKIVKFAGISPDGEELYVELGDSANTDLYYGKNFLKTCNQLILFNNNINSPYHECSVSLAPDGNTLYFSSDRPGGYGGYDIYKSIKEENGEWGKAENLGAVINSKYDELYPFIHPSLTKLYFSSTGHQTMGGFDIFEANLEQGKWESVKNIGYPINTTFDDMNYSMTAEGSSAYLSSTRNDRTQHFDIYKVYLKESIPLTLVKGRILGGNPPKPIGATIQVLDKQTNEPLKYIYNPNPKTGQYLLIFPPGKNYDMIVKAKGYKPYIINIYIPNQTYFYENFQEIRLSPILVNSLGETVGEEIQVKNTFYDVYKTNNSLSDAVNRPKNYDKLLNIIEELIIKTDTLGLNVINEYAVYIDENSSQVSEIKQQTDYDKLFSLVEEAIETTDSTTLRILDKNSIPSVSYENRYFYNKNEPTKDLEPILVGSDTIFVVTAEKNNKQKESKQEEQTSYSEINTVTGLSIYFERNDSKVPDRYKKSLKELAQLSSDNPNLYIKIVAYANPNEKAQQAVSRAIEVRSVLVLENLSIEKTNTVAAIQKTNLQKEGRRVDVAVFESKKPLYKKGSFSAAVKLIKIGEQDCVVNSKEGVVYKVQIAAGSNLLSEKDVFFKLENVQYYTHDNLYKYVVGEFTNLASAQKEQKRLLDKGFEGAFVVKFINGVRVD